jgi:hypothetical protein
LSSPKPINRFPRVSKNYLPMLVTRQPDTQQSPWSFSKYETTYHKPPASPPRMSNHIDTPFSTQPDWQGQYSYLPPGDSNIFSQSYEQSNDNSEAAQPRTTGGSGTQLDVTVKDEQSSPLRHQRSLDPLGLRQTKQPSPIPEQPEQQGGETYASKAVESVHDESLVSADAPGLSMNSNPLSSVSAAGQGPDIPATHNGIEGDAVKPEDGDDVLDDEDMVEGEDEGTSQPQTAAERTAQRRKMKRFRYDDDALGFPHPSTEADTQQTHAPTNSISHERIREAATP